MPFLIPLGAAIATGIGATGTAATIIGGLSTIGIGAGGNCSAQVLVLYDMLGIYSGKKSRFIKNFMVSANSISEAVENYVKEVKSGKFPGLEHGF